MSCVVEALLEEHEQQKCQQDLGIRAGSPADLARAAISRNVPCLVGEVVPKRAQEMDLVAELEPAHADQEGPRILGRDRVYGAQQQQRRLFWGRASGVSAWLGFGRASDSDATPDKASPKTPASPASMQSSELEPPGGDGHATSRRPKAKRKRKHKRKQLWLRPLPPQGMALPAIQRSVDPSEHRAAEKAAKALSGHLESVSTSAQLLSAWQTVSQYRPFVLMHGSMCLASKDESAADDTTTQDDGAPSFTPLLQMVSADAFAQLSATSDANSRALVGSNGVAPASKRRSKMRPAPATGVILVNESMVVSSIVQTLGALDSHVQAISLFEAYDDARRVWLEEQLLSVAISSGDGEHAQLSELLLTLERAARLDPRAYLAYLRSTEIQKQAYKLQRLVKVDMRHLQAACRLRESDAVLAMVRHWMNVITKATKSDSAHLAAAFKGRSARTAPKSDVNSGLSDVERFQHAAREELLHLALGEMLAKKHSASVIKEVLGIMQSTGVPCRSAMLKMVVAALFESGETESSLPSDQVVKDALDFWKHHSSVVVDPGYLVRLLLEACLARQWYNECDSVLDFLVLQRLPRVPCAAIVKVMKANEANSRFAANADIGRKLLTGLVRTARHGLDADFYEHYLTSCVHLERFQAVRHLRGQQHLTRRFPHSKVIQSLLLSM